MMEMERLQIDVLGLAEVRGTESGIIDKEKYVMAFSGGEKNQHWVGIMMMGRVYKALQGYLPISDRMITWPNSREKQQILLLYNYMHQQMITVMRK